MTRDAFITRLRAGLTALGGSPDRFEVRLVQFVSLFRGGEKAQISTRSLRSGTMPRRARTSNALTKSVTFY